MAKKARKRAARPTLQARVRLKNAFWYWGQGLEWGNNPHREEGTPTELVEPCCCAQPELFEGDE